MVDVDVRDGDFVVTAGFTSGLLLEQVAAAGVDVTVLVAGPTFDREYAGMSIAEFAANAPAADVQLLLPQGETRRLLDDDLAAYIPSRSPDQTAIVRRMMGAADRVVASVETSAPEDGIVTPGACGLFVPTILTSADVTVAEVNPNAPRLPGLSYRVDRFDHRLEGACELPLAEREETDEVAAQIGENVAAVVPDGATIELGIGRISEAIASALVNRSDLGIHSGFVRPTVRDLVERGTVTRGSQVAERLPDSPLEHPVLANTVLGDEASFYEWAVDSRCVALSDMRRTTDPALVAANPKFTAVNGALQVDIQGQVNAERFGGRQLGTAGGQPAYFRAARKSSGGTGIVALPSQRPDGTANIVASLVDDSVVTTSRLDYDYVVTEQGVAKLFGEDLAGRTAAILDVAPPERRDELAERARSFGLL